MEQLVVPDEDVLVGQAAAHAARHGAALPVLAEHLDPGVVVPHLRQRHARQVAAQRGAAPTQTLVTTILGQAMQFFIFTAGAIPSTGFPVKS